MLVLKAKLELESSDTCSFKDTTGNILDTAYSQSGNITYSDVDCVRLKIGTYSTLANPSSPTGGDFVQYTEYQKIDGLPETINNKTFVAGDYFVPQFANLQTAEPTNWETTGYYVYPYLDTWLPTQTEVPLDITVSQLGQSGTEIEDNEYIYEYEVYYDVTTTTTPAVDGTTYIVFGTVGDTTSYVTYNGNLYYLGEVFTAYDTTDITPSGTPSFAKLYAATTGYSTMTYFLDTTLNDLIEQQIGLGSQDLVNNTYGEIMKIRMKLEALHYSSYTNNVSLLYAWETINLLTSRISQLLRP